MSMRSLNKRDCWIDGAGLISIGIICLGYILFIRPFAELHIQFSFLNFPIFIAEWLIFLCLCLSVIKNRHQLTMLNKKRILIVAYFAFVVIKALYGYWKWGPLAFRHAALLYYPIFILFGYAFYRRDFFNTWKAMALSTLIIFLFILPIWDTYWTLTCFILAVILIFSLRRPMPKYILLGVLLIVTPYQHLFHTSRMMMVSNFVAIVYLMSVLYLVLKIDKKVKIVLLLVGSLIFLVGALKFADKNALRSIVSLKRIGEAFNYYNADVMAGLERYEQAHAVPQNSELALTTPQGSLPSQKSVQEADGPGHEPVRLYNPNIALSFDLNSKKDIQPLGSAVSLSSRRQASVKLYNPNTFSFFEKQDIASSLSANVAGRDFDGAVNNVVFRLFIWRDMIDDLIRVKPILGFDFGKPLRSKSLEILNWGTTEWSRDGWIGAHNSYLDIIYRTGVFGFVFIVTLLYVLFSMIKEFIVKRSVVGLLLCGILINWLVAANFLLILELPYTAVPIWTIFGLTLGYRNKTLRQKQIA